MPEPLSNPQIRKLKGLAQRMEPTLTLGKAGLSDAFVQSLNVELERHELIKVKLAEFKDQRKTLAPQMAERASAHLIALVGHVVVLYRRNEKSAVLPAT
jgi:RNA-binding protein